MQLTVKTSPPHREGCNPAPESCLFDGHMLKICPWVFTSLRSIGPADLQTLLCNGRPPPLAVLPTLPLSPLHTPLFCTTHTRRGSSPPRERYKTLFSHP